MKNIIVFISCLFLSAQILADEVSIMNQGACWVSDSIDNLKVASFNESKSYTITKDSLDSLIPIFRGVGLSIENSTSIQAFSHCSAMGMRHVFKVNFDSGVSYCLWSQFEKGEFKKIDLDLADSDYNGLCDGIIANKLLISLKEGFVIEDIINELRDMNIEVLNSSKVSSSIIVMEFKVKENEIFEIHKKIQKVKKLKFADFVTRQRPIGDVLASEALSVYK